MKAFVTSIGEPSTDLCVWSLIRLGFDVELIKGKSLLGTKLKQIFNSPPQNFLRVDADVIVNKNVLQLIEQNELLWYQSLTFDWYKQDLAYGGVQFIREDVFELVRPHLEHAETLDRPESYLSRIPELHDPRTFGNYYKICGLHGYRQNDYNRVKQVKARRGQSDNYDFELAERLEQ